ncbi:MAG: ferric reductase-like transmembrane domain-containing protein [Chromatocurvus sp.]
MRLTLRSPPPRRGGRPWWLLILYAALICTPLTIALIEGPLLSRPVIDHIASAIAILAFAALLAEFLFSGRHRWISGRIGLNRTINIHRRIAYVIIALIVVHPFMYTASDGAWPWFNAADPELNLSALSLFSGFGAFVLVAVIVLTAADRHQLPWRYETWRLVHVGAAVSLAALVAVHAISANGYSARTSMMIYWALLLGMAMLTLIELFIVRPWQQRRLPYLVQRIEQIGGRTWELSLRPEGPDAAHRIMHFRPGQFAWLTFGRQSFDIGDHPFSMSTAATDSSTIGFTIKEKGDFTAGIGEIPAGSRVFLDGPHGHLIPDDDPIPTVYIVAGTGIGPVLSHLRTFYRAGDPRSLTLLYCVPSETSIAHLEELHVMSDTLALSVHPIVQDPGPLWRGAVGQMDHRLLDTLLPRDERRSHRYFVCGPESLVKPVRAALRRLKIPDKRIVTGS